MSGPSFRLTYVPHARWPLPVTAKASKGRSRPASPNETTSSSAHGTLPPVRICVLDSSFNPPHSAHLALVRDSPGGPPRISNSSSPVQSFDARLLVLSSKNADKGSTAQHDLENRLRMMEAMARYMNEPGTGRSHEAGLNVAVACMDSPTFVGKSRGLKNELTSLEHMRGRSVEMVFPVGWDTIIRFFAQRYYQPPNPPMHQAMSGFFNADKSWLSCARRGADVSREDEEAFLQTDEVRPWRDRVVLFDLNEDEAKEVSSTRIRDAVKRGDDGELEKLVPVPEVRRIIKSEGLYK